MSERRNRRRRDRKARDARLATIVENAAELRRLRKRAAEVADLEHRLRVHAEAGRISPLELHQALNAPPEAVQALLDELDR